MIIVPTCVQSYLQLALEPFLPERLKEELISLQGRRYAYLVSSVIASLIFSFSFSCCSFVPSFLVH